MNFTEFQQEVRHILAVDLPSGKSVVEQACSMATDIKIGRSAFLDKMGVGSELAYKKQCLKDNRIMFHAHIGMSSWEATAKALTYLHKTAKESEIIIDRAGICLDRRMGLPPSHRKNIPAETGPMLENARRLKEEMDRQGLNIPVVLGGILNQKIENQSLPVDVTDDLKKLEFIPCPKLEGNFRNLLEANIDHKQIPPDLPLQKGGS